MKEQESVWLCSEDFSSSAENLDFRLELYVGVLTQDDMGSNAKWV